MGKIKIRRDSKGILRQYCPKVLLDSRNNQFRMNESKEFDIASKQIRLIINNSKSLSFELNEDEIREFVIKESYNDFGFISRILFLLVLLFGSLYTSEKTGIGLALIWTYSLFYTFREEYFYIEEE